MGPQILTKALNSTAHFMENH